MYLTYLNQSYPMRHDAKEKQKFRDYVQGELKDSAFSVKIEENKKHNNIVIGDTDSAKVIFTAHYDTPWRAFVPNLMIVTNKALFWVYNFGIAIILLAAALLAARGILTLTGLSRGDTLGYFVWYFSFLIIYIGLFVLLMFNGKNKNNFNDNTSGTAAILEMAKSLDGNKNIAFILFDDEEKGKLGSKAFAKAHPLIKKNVPVINLDCVGNGTHFVINSTEKAIGHSLYNKFSNSWKNEGEYDFLLLNSRQAAMNSDHKSFDLGIGVCSCLKSNILGFYADRIHTSRDTVVSEANIDYLVAALSAFTKSI